jgi:xanthine dehydrogenase YagS FAD-binding subunit
MKPFAYTTASTEAEACTLLGQDALALAGGTNLLNLIKELVVEPRVLVDIKQVEGLNGIDAADDGFRIGANVTLSEVLAHRELARAYPALHQAIAETASPQIRNRGTIGGDLCARPPCWYFAKAAFGCAKKGGEGCPAKDGDNEYHAIFGTDGPCVMVPATSLAPALMSLGAKVRIAGPGSSRDVALGEFFTVPAKDITRENVLAPNEIVTHVILGAASPNSASYQIKHKATYDWPLVTASVALDLDGDTCRGARVVLGAVAPVPWRAASAESALSGKAVTAQSAERAGEAAVEGAKPLSQNGYKVAATRAAVKRAVLLAATGKWN